MYDTSNLPLKSKHGGGGGVRMPMNKGLPRQNQYTTPQHQQYSNPPPYNPLSHVYDTSNPVLRSGWLVMGGRCGCLGCKRRPRQNQHPTPHHQQHCNLTPTTLCFMYISNPPLKSKWWVLGGWCGCLGCKRRPRQNQHTTPQHQQHCNLST